MERLLITQKEQTIWTVLKKMDVKKPVQIQLQSVNEELALHQVRIGKVRDIVKNIQAAFIDLGDGKQGFYSLTENPSHLLTAYLPEYATDTTEYTEQEEFPCFTEKVLKPGDEILVQVQRDAVKTKDPVLTSHINLTGRLVVLTAGKLGIGISGKIKDEAWKKEIKERLYPHLSKQYGIILRTNARDASFEEILQELSQLRTLFYQIIRKGRFSSCYSLLYQENATYLSLIRDMDIRKLEEIVTDSPEIYEEVSHYLAIHHPDNQPKLRYYQDTLLSLFNLYSLQEALDHALKKQVWLKSGGYLVIEPTEALTVIDVNTGKYTGKKTMRETIRNMNLEAAKVIGEEIRLRNLSGIIVVDFIDMKYTEDDEELLQEMRRIVSMDPVKTTVVDMTPLHLMELTRKKTMRPLAEQVALTIRNST